MELGLAIIADYASIDKSNGKLNVLGIFARINARDFPVTHERLAVVVRFKPDIADPVDGHSLQVSLVNADDHSSIIKIDGPVKLPLANAGPRPDFSLVLELNNLVFPTPGEYRFEIWGDGELKGEIPIELVKLPQSE